LVGSFQQDRAAIGAALSLIKFRNNRSIKNIWEEQTLCCGMSASITDLYHGEAFRVSKIMNFQG
jgi:hypothetical protein